MKYFKAVKEPSRFATMILRYLDPIPINAIQLSDEAFEMYNVMFDNADGSINFRALLNLFQNESDFYSQFNKHAFFWIYENYRNLNKIIMLYSEFEEISLSSWLEELSECRDDYFDYIRFHFKGNIIDCTKFGSADPDLVIELISDTDPALHATLVENGEAIFTDLRFSSTYIFDTFINTNPIYVRLDDLQGNDKHRWVEFTSHGRQLVKRAYSSVFALKDYIKNEPNDSTGSIRNDFIDSIIVRIVESSFPEIADFPRLKYKLRGNCDRILSIIIRYSAHATGYRPTVLQLQEIPRERHHLITPPGKVLLILPEREGIKRDSSSNPDYPGISIDNTTIKRKDLADSAYLFYRPDPDHTSSPTDKQLQDIDICDQQRFRNSFTLYAIHEFVRSRLIHSGHGLLEKIIEKDALEPLSEYFDSIGNLRASLNIIPTFISSTRILDASLWVQLAAQASEAEPDNSVDYDFFPSSYVEMNIMRLASSARKTKNNDILVKQYLENIAKLINRKPDLFKKDMILLPEDLPRLTHKPMSTWENKMKDIDFLQKLINGINKKLASHQKKNEFTISTWRKLRSECHYILDLLNAKKSMGKHVPYNDNIKYNDDNYDDYDPFADQY